MRYLHILFLLLLPGFALAQGGRTLDELKAEMIARADRGAYPLIGLKPAEVREAAAKLHTIDRDEWAAVWSSLGDRYMQAKDYRQAWLYYSFARWPVPNSPGKQRAYDKALEAYLALARPMDPPLEVLRVPVQGGEVVAYLRLPKSASPSPLVVAIAGLDSRKEEMVERFSPLLAQGIGVLALDSPGTGQSPVKAVPGAEATLVRAMDAVLERPQVDRKRVAVYGGSFGGYWATIIAATQTSRLRAVVAQSPPIDETFSRERTAKDAANREYLFDYIPAQLFTFGAASMSELEEARVKLSLKGSGVLERPMPPMLVIGGVVDSQVPMADIELLLRSGVTPKDAWINPRGGHMGREPKEWPDPVIFRRVTTPWLLRALQPDA